MLDCLICESAELKFLFTKNDRNYHRCNSCGLIAQHPFPSPDELKQLYECSYKDGMYKDFAIADDLKQATARRRFREIEKSIPFTEKWLDVGCSTGAFVQAGMDRGIDIQGIDISKEAVQIGVNKGLPLRCESVDDFSHEEKFDCITAFDLIEHLSDPGVFLRNALELLNPGGKLVLTTPNLNSVPRFLMGRRWYFYIPDEHLTLFTPSSLSSLLNKEGFGVVEAGPTYKPMTFNYAYLQFKEFNPLIARAMKVLTWFTPNALRSAMIHLPIGEQRLIAVKET